MTMNLCTTGRRTARLLPVYRFGAPVMVPFGNRPPLSFLPRLVGPLYRR